MEKTHHSLSALPKALLDRRAKREDSQLLSANPKGPLRQEGQLRRHTTPCQQPPKALLDRMAKGEDPPLPVSFP